MRRLIVTFITLWLASVTALGQSNTGRIVGAVTSSDGVIPGATIKIFDLAARWVRTLQPTSDSISWDLRNDKGDLVASGLYIYLITDNQGAKVRGKLTLIK